MEQKRRLVDRIIDPAYIEGLGDRTLEDLRAMREESRESENELSFERRLCQARVDILSAELERRSGKGEGSLVERLPEILAGDEGRRDVVLPARAPDFSMPRNADIPRRRVEEIVGEQTLARLSELSEQEIKSIIQSVGEHERTLSERRKKVHDVMDRIQDEIVRRYVSGEADPAATLG